MIKDYGLSQKETAEKLNLTPAAVCQYVSKKRGKTEISNEILLNEIKLSANRIIKNGDGHILKETCRICKLLRADEGFNLYCAACDNKD